MSMFTADGDEVLPNNQAVPSLDAIAYGLARQIRFSGQTKEPYSVLVHSMCLADFMQPHERIFALMHDSTEAVMSDVVRPWKPEAFSNLEDKLLERICKHYGIPWPWPQEIAKRVKEADILLGDSEGVALGFFPDASKYKHSERMIKAVHAWIPFSKIWINEPDQAASVFRFIFHDAMKSWKEHSSV